MNALHLRWEKETGRLCIPLVDYYKFLDNYRKGKFKFEPSEKNTLGFAFVYVFSKHRGKNLELYVRLANEKDDNEARQIISDSFIFV